MFYSLLRKHPYKVVITPGVVVERGSNASQRSAFRAEPYPVVPVVVDDE